MIEGESNIRVLLVSISAKNIHKPLAPWCLKAYCDFHNTQCEIEIAEFSINDNLNGMLGKIYTSAPDVLAFSCYIWNIEQVGKLANMAKKLMPNCVIVLGGPEVSFETPSNSFPYANYIVQGAGEVAFYNLLEALQPGNAHQECAIITGFSEPFSSFPSPYTEEYFNSFTKSKMAGLANQLIYYESSRGCPFNCSYCLSSVSDALEYLPLERVKDDLALLVSKGASCIKFVDRTFNADKRRAKEILSYIYSLDTQCTFHFEAAGDLFDEELLELIARMPAARVQFEIGIQSTNKPTLDAVGRKTDIEKSLASIKRLASIGNCHIHVDLIAGLPHETIKTFFSAVDSCIYARPNMLQLGFLKLLKGSALRQNSAMLGYCYTDYPPYEALKSSDMSFHDIIILKGVEEVVDKFYNSGMYKNSIWYAIEKLFRRPYQLFYELSLYANKNGGIKVSLKGAYTLLYNFLLQYGDKTQVEHVIKLDCLTHDAKGMLPAVLPQQRDKAAEIAYKKHPSRNYKNIRIEYFDYDGKYRLFNYEVKDKVTASYEVVVLDVHAKHGINL